MLGRVSRDVLACGLAPFVTELVRDPDFGDGTRSAIAEPARDEGFLLAVEDDLGRPGVMHSESAFA